MTTLLNNPETRPSPARVPGQRRPAPAAPPTRPGRGAPRGPRRQVEQVPGIDGLSPRRLAVAPVRATRAPQASTAPTPVRASARPRVVLTRRGRLVLFLLTLACVLAAVVAVGSGLAGASREAGTPEPVRVVEVSSGDTLFGIAGEVAAPGQVRAMVQRIEDLNGLADVTIEEGQRLAVPLH